MGSTCWAGGKGGGKGGHIYATALHRRKGRKKAAHTRRFSSYPGRTSPPSLISRLPVIILTHAYPRIYRASIPDALYSRPASGNYPRMIFVRFAGTICRRHKAPHPLRFSVSGLTPNPAPAHPIRPCGSSHGVFPFARSQAVWQPHMRSRGLAFLAASASR